MTIRKANHTDISSVEAVYNEIHDSEESGMQAIGWKRGIYPVRATAEAALSRDDLFVMEDNSKSIVGTAIINQRQEACYQDGKWVFDVPEDKVCVLHTMVISPRVSGKGCAKDFIQFYEDYAREAGCLSLRIDTNVKNVKAQKMYQKLGYKEAGIVQTDFNGLSGVQLVLFEKKV